MQNLEPASHQQVLRIRTIECSSPWKNFAQTALGKDFSEIFTEFSMQPSEKSFSKRWEMQQMCTLREFHLKQS